MVSKFDVRWIMSGRPAPIKWTSAVGFGHGPGSIMTNTPFGLLVIAKPRAMGGAYVPYLNEIPLQIIAPGKKATVRARAEQFIMTETARKQNTESVLKNVDKTQRALIFTVAEWTVKAAERGLNLQAIQAEISALLDQPDKHGLHAGRFYIVENKGERRIWQRTDKGGWYLPGSEEEWPHNQADKIIGEADLNPTRDDAPD